jgi:hypothetical protein
MRDLSMVGCTGVLTIGTRGAGGAGEAIISYRGGTESLLAWSDDPMPKGTPVLVVDVIASRTVRVIRCDGIGTA